MMAGGGTRLLSVSPQSPIANEKKKKSVEMNTSHSTRATEHSGCPKRKWHPRDGLNRYRGRRVRRRPGPIDSSRPPRGSRRISQLPRYTGGLVEPRGDTATGLSGVETVRSNGTLRPTTGIGGWRAVPGDPGRPADQRAGSGIRRRPSVSRDNSR